MQTEGPPLGGVQACETACMANTAQCPMALFLWDKHDTGPVQQTEQSKSVVGCQNSRSGC